MLTPVCHLSRTLAHSSPNTHSQPKQRNTSKSLADFSPRGFLTFDLWPVSCLCKEFGLQKGCQSCEPGPNPVDLWTRSWGVGETKPKKRIMYVSRCPRAVAMKSYLAFIWGWDIDPFPWGQVLWQGSPNMQLLVTFAFQGSNVPKHSSQLHEGIPVPSRTIIPSPRIPIRP